MNEALISIGKTILFLGGICIALSLVAWVILLVCYILYVIKEM